MDRRKICWKTRFWGPFLHLVSLKRSQSTPEHTILHQKWDIFGNSKVVWDPLLSIRAGRRPFETVPVAPSEVKVTEPESLAT